MANEIKPVSRDQVLYYGATAIAAGQTLPETTDGGGGPAGDYVIYKAEGCARVWGIVSGSQAPAAGFPRIRFWASPGDINVLTAIATYVLTVDPANANTFLIDTPLYSPFFSIEWTQGGAPGTFTGIAQVSADPGALGATSIGPVIPIFVKDSPLTPLGFNTFTVDNVTAKGLGSGSVIPAGAIYAQVQVGTGVPGDTSITCNYRDDGVAPTSAVGFPLLVGATLFYEGTPLSNFQIIGTAAGPSTVNVLFYK